MVNRLHHLLIEEYKNNRNVVLIIDEAQNMPVETLENLRMLSNLETSEDKLLQILLVGQPELERILNLHELRQLRQRIAIRCQINPLTEAESLAYIQHRLAKASALGQMIFAEGSLKPIIKEARGIPRIINILCDNALITGFGYQKKPIGRKIVKEVVSEYLGQKPRRRLRWWLAPLAAAVLATFLLSARFPFPPEIAHHSAKTAPQGTSNQVQQPAAPAGPTSSATQQATSKSGAAPPSLPSSLMGREEAKRVSSESTGGEPQLATSSPPGGTVLTPSATDVPAFGMPAPLSDTVIPSADAATPSARPVTSPAGPSTPSTGTLEPSAGAATPATGAVVPSAGAITPSTSTAAPIAGTASLPSLDGRGRGWVAEQPLGPPHMSGSPVVRVSNRMQNLVPPQPELLTPGPLPTLAATGSPASVPAPENDAVSITVKEGDCISSLVRDVYGRLDPRLIEVVRQSNPQIKDLNIIRSGDRILFPKSETKW